MAGALGDLVVALHADIAKFQSDMGKAAHIADQRMSQISGFAKRAAGLVGVAFSGLTIGEVFKGAITQAKEAEEASKRLSSTLRATGSAAGLTKQQLDGMADAMAQSTQFDDESIRNAASQLLIFRNIQGDTFRETLKLSADVAAFFGIGIPEAAAKLGKSLEDPETAFGLLKRAGVVLTEQQKDQIKAMGDLGDRAGQQRVVLERLQGAFGGMAAEMNTGITKATADLTKSWDELLESLGKSGPVQMAAQGGLLSIAGALNVLREAHDKATRQFAERALSPGIYIAPTGKELPMLPPSVKPGEFSSQLNAMASPEVVSQEELQKRNTARLSADAQRRQQLADAQYVAEREAAKKAAEAGKAAAREAAAYRKKMTEMDIQSWSAAIDEETRVYEEGLRQQAKELDDHAQLVEKYRKIDAESWVAHIDAMTEEYERGLVRQAKDLDDTTRKNAESMRDLSHAVSTAFEDAVISGKKLKDVLVSLGQTIAQILIRKNVTKPLEEAVGNFDFGDIGKSLGKLLGFGGGGGSSTGGQGAASVADTLAFWGGAAFAEGTDFVPRTGLALLHKGEAVIPASENAGSSRAPVFNVDMRGASVEAVARLERLVASVNGSIERRALGVMNQSRVRGTS